jgi:SAM-dependent methyltransferase
MSAVRWGRGWWNMAEDWDQSADAWIALMRAGNWGRLRVVDPALMSLLAGRGFRRMLDVGCGEGRLCRMVQPLGISAVGIDPTDALIAEARAQDPTGDYRLGVAEALPVPDASFDLVMSCLSLIDIPDFRAAIAEMARALAPGGSLVIANLSNLVTGTKGPGWVNDAEGAPLYYPVDSYLAEFANWAEWAGIRVRNWHRPLSAYMAALLGAGLVLRHYQEPDAVGGPDAMAQRHRKCPFFVVMEWVKPV